MILESILGTLIGGGARLGQEWLRQKDADKDRDHEFRMFNLQIEADKLKGKMALEQADMALGTADIQAMIEATKAQAQQTGIKWVDALSATVRPIITYAFMMLYTFAKISSYKAALVAGEVWYEAVQQLWGQQDYAIWSAIIGFWFVDRSLRKAQ